MSLVVFVSVYALRSLNDRYKEVSRSADLFPPSVSLGQGLALNLRNFSDCSRKHVLETDCCENICVKRKLLCQT